MAETIAELRALSDEDLTRRHDSHAASVVVATGHYLDELRRRDASRSEARMIALTERVVRLTDHIRGLTILAVVVAAVALFVATASLAASLQR
jgi:glycerol-3-phosphate dehydrogenase